MSGQAPEVPVFLSDRVREDCARIGALCREAPRYAVFTAVLAACLRADLEDIMDVPDAFWEMMKGVRAVLTSTEELSEDALVAALLDVSRAAAVIRQAGIPAAHPLDVLPEGTPDAVRHALLAHEVMET